MAILHLFFGVMVLTTAENTEMALEDILLRTGEMDHLETLLRYYARDKPGLSPQNMLETVVHPLLDELEQYVIAEVSAADDPVHLKEIVHQWIASRMDD